MWSRRKCLNPFTGNRMLYPCGSDSFINGNRLDGFRRKENASRPYLPACLPFSKHLALSPQRRLGHFTEGWSPNPQRELRGIHVSRLWRVKLLARILSIPALVMDKLHFHPLGAAARCFNTAELPSAIILGADKEIQHVRSAIVARAGRRFNLELGHFIVEVADVPRLLRAWVVKRHRIAPSPVSESCIAQ